MESTLRHPTPASLDVIETLRFDPDDGFIRLGLHIDRAQRTCARLEFPFDRGTCLMQLGEGVGDTAARVRMTINDSGVVGVKVAPLTGTKPIWRISMAAERVQADDPWLQVKTTQRALYDRSRAALPDNLDEFIFLNEMDEICEGTISNVFVDRGGVLLTPPTSCGLLQGILRQELLETGQAMESVLTVRDLQTADSLYVGNSLRGLIGAEFVS